MAGKGKRRRLCRQHGGALPAPPGRPRTSISRCEPRGFRKGRGPLTSQPPSWLRQQHSMSARGEQATLLSRQVSEHPNHRIIKHGRRCGVRTEKPPGTIWLIQARGGGVSPTHTWRDRCTHCTCTGKRAGSRAGALCNGRSDKNLTEQKSKTWSNHTRILKSSRRKATRVDTWTGQPFRTQCCRTNMVEFLQ